MSGIAKFDEYSILPAICTVLLDVNNTCHSIMITMFLRLWLLIYVTLAEMFRWCDPFKEGNLSNPNSCPPYNYILVQAFT